MNFSLHHNLRLLYRNSARKLVELIIVCAKLNVREIYYQQNGILKATDESSGELWFIDTILPLLVSDINRPVFLDVGANVGHYSLKLVRSIPTCHCYALEPNPITFIHLADNCKHKGITPLPYGAGSKKETSVIYSCETSAATEHASLYQNVLTDFHRHENTVEYSCLIATIDSLVENGLIQESCIHFLKIDTEGHEFECLKGATRLLSSSSLVAIQFEFNEMNVISRTYLKDFYDLLGSDWSFFRLDTSRLIPLGAYDSANEIFKFNNIVALRKHVLQRIGL